MYVDCSLHIPAELALDAQTLYFFADAIPHQVWVADPHGHPVYVNKQWSAYTGLSIDEAKKLAWLFAIHPQDRGKMWQMWQDVLATGTDLLSEARFKRHDGVYRWQSIRATPQRNAEGQIWLWVGTCTDIESQKQAEQSLKACEENFRSLTDTIDTLPQQVWITLANNSLIYCNQRCLDYNQGTFEDIQGFGWRHFVHPDDLQQVLDFQQRLQQTSEPYEIEARLKEKQTGLYRWFLIRGVPVHDVGGQTIKWFGTDIHERKHIEEALQESERRFRRLVESNIIGITIADSDGTIHEANEAYLSLFGYTQEDLAAGRINWRAMTPPEYREQDEQAIKKFLKIGINFPFEKEYFRKDGSRVPVMIASALLHGEGPLQQWVTLTLDLRTRKEVERQKDFFLAMTGHELKTPLAALKGTLQLLMLRIKRLTAETEVLSPELRTFLDDLSQRLRDSTRLVDTQTHVINDLLDVSRITTNTLHLEQEPCDLVPIVRETVEDLRLTAPERSLQLALPEHTVLLVHADRQRIGQVLKNYVTNALRYAPADQPIQVGLRLQEQVARVWVQDQGPGLSVEAQQQVWQRFHQVKGNVAQNRSGKGLGLGLYLCQMLIAGHQGQVGVESTLGEGSTFWFTLPLIT